ncbi:MAG: hydrogenase 4 subunit B [Rhodospirillales bacterium]|nr:hydrogenase 4 subunit B [Rhodospirillales bacterium]
MMRKDLPPLGGRSPVEEANVAAQALLAVAVLPLLTMLAMSAHRHKLAPALVHGGCLLVSLLLGFIGIASVLKGGADLAALPIGLPWLKAHFRIDAFSGLFLVIVNLGALAASLFGVSYVKHLNHAPRVAAAYPMFLAGMNLALMADDAFSFLVSWEFMSVSSWLLVLIDHEEEENRKAAFTYLMMALFGTFCLLGAFGILAQAGGGYGFDAMRTAKLDGLQSSLVVLLALLGAGSKAGLVPLHAWLPLAHPAAPSHVSALMSGVMTKVALYILCRFLFDFGPTPAWWWGAIIMVAGGVTAVAGILYALIQTDLKRLLAYSTVENVGIALIGLGIALAFKGEGMLPFAALALAASLYHMLNHSVMKGLLFLGAGAVLSATNERNIERLGGLIHRMPVTAACFLAGAAAISALPPLNGFVSEWLILQTLFLGPKIPNWAMKFGSPVVAAMVALSAAMAAAAFVRAFGLVFLGRARSQAALLATEAPIPMRISLIGLAALCALLGILPVSATTILSQIAQSLMGIELQGAIIEGWPWLAPISVTRGSYSGTVLVASVLFLILVTAVIIKGFGTRQVRRGPAWDCGHKESSPAFQYTASSFAQPLRRVFGASMFQAREDVDMPSPSEIRPARLDVHMRDPIWQGLYQPLIDGVTHLAARLNRLQTMTVRRHLLMMFLTLMLMLIVAALRRVFA